MNDANNTRAAQRREPRHTLPVFDAISEQTIGQVGNVSRTGMLLICRFRLANDGLYQLRFTLPGEQQPLQVGVHEQWTEAASVPGQFWSGVRIIDISPQDEARLVSWVQSA